MANRAAGFTASTEDIVTPRIVTLRACALALAMCAAVPQAATAAIDVLNASDERAYAAAVAAAERGAWDEAMAAARAAKEPALRDWLTWKRMLEPHSGLSFAAITDFLREHPNWPWRTTLNRRAEEAITAAEDATQVYAWFQDKEPVSADGWIALSSALERLGRTEELTATVRRAWRETTFGTAQEKAFVARFGGRLTDEDHRARLDWLLWERDTDAARRMLRLVDADRRALAQARIGLMDGAGGVDALVARVPQGLINDPGLVFDRMRWRRTRGLEDGALELLNHPKADSVRPDLWWRERSILARDALEAGRHAQAYRIISGHEAAEGYPLADAEFMAGWIALRFLDKPAEALPHFERLFANVTTPISLSRGAYWAGRAKEALGDAAGAQTWYRKAAEHGTTYYGQLAAEKVEGITPASFTVDPQPTAADIAFVEGHPLARVAAALVEIGREDDISPFITQLQAEAGTAGAKLLAVELAARLGLPHVSVAASRRAAMDGVTLIGPGYPVSRFATAPGIEEALVLSVIRQESNFNPDAVSRVGAKGLMQLMPATAKSQSHKLDLDYAEPRLTREPAYNVALGSSYMQSLIQRFRGSYILAVAGYNAGPGRPAQWVERFGDPRTGAIDPVDWVEMIPFSETRNYVQRVLEGVQVYRLRLGVEGPPLSQDLRR